MNKFGWTILLTMVISYHYIYYRSSEVVTLTVEHREPVTTGSGDSIQSYYLVWTQEGEVFQVVDSLIFLTWNSSDRYGQLREGTTVQAQVAGWRIPFLSQYRNIIKVQPVP